MGQGSCVRGDQSDAGGRGGWPLDLLDFICLGDCHWLSSQGPGLAHGVESAWWCPFLQATVHAIREPQSQAPAARAPTASAEASSDGLLLLPRPPPHGFRIWALAWR